MPPSNARWCDTRVGTEFVSITGVRGVVTAIAPPFVTARLADGSTRKVQVRPADPVEIVLPEGEGLRNVIELLGASEIA